MCNRAHHTWPALVLFSLFVARTTEAGPWPRAFGSAYVKLGAAQFSADSGADSNAASVSGFTYESETYNVYAEIGLPHRLTVVADLPYVTATHFAPTGYAFDNRTLGDGRFELSYSVLEGIPVAVAVEAKVPFYDSIDEQADDGVLAVDGEQWPASAFPNPGDGNVDVTVKLQLGHSFHPLPAWITFETGYRLRLDGYADGLHSAANFGAFIWPDHLALGVYGSSVLNLESSVSSDGKTSREYAYVQGYMLLTAAPWAPDLSLIVSAGTVAWAQHAATGTDMGVAMAWHFRGAP